MSDRKNKSHLLFALLCLAMIVWTFFSGILYSFTEIPNIELSLKFAYIGGFLISPIILHFYLVISRTRIKRYYLVLNYLPAVFLIISNFTDFFIFSSLIKYENEWLGVLNTGNILMQVYILEVIITFVVSFLIILKWNSQTKINKEKIQSRYILIFFTLTYFTSLFMSMVLPVFGIHRYQYTGISFLALFIVGLYFIISKYRFLNLDKNLPAGEIISNINELVFILDKDFAITDINRAVCDFFNTTAEELKKKLFFDIITDSREILSGIKPVIAGDTKNLTTIVHYDTDSGIVPARAYFSGIKDKFNDNSGFFIISSEIKGMAQFQKAFKITGRELQIIGLTVTGSTYREISEKLEISERTVERHLVNIYNKLGINNKIELFRMADEYNLKL